MSQEREALEAMKIACDFALSQCDGKFWRENEPSVIRAMELYEAVSKNEPSPYQNRTHKMVTHLHEIKRYAENKHLVWLAAHAERALQ